MKNKITLLIVITLFLIILNPYKGVYAQNYSLTIITRNNTYTFYYPEVELKQGKYYLKDKLNVIDKIYLDSITLPKNAKLKVDSGQNIVIEKGQNGYCVDKSFLAKQIDTALKNSTEKIYAVYKEIYPEIDSAYLNRCTNLRGQFSTNFSFSTPERKQNIFLACEKINGTTLFSGEEFSFNQVVGKRTQENGFKNAKVIQEGQFIEGIGGGVCQVSTTLYNAVLLSGLQISEYHPHSLAVGYVEKSFDAMVTDLWADLKFVNNTSGIITIFSSINQDVLQISLYGTSPEFTYQRESIVQEELLPEVKIEYVSALVKGEQVVKVQGKSGFKSLGILKKYRNGVFVEKTILRNDEYKKIDTLVLQGE